MPEVQIIPSPPRWTRFLWLNHDQRNDLGNGSEGTCYSGVKKDISPCPQVPREQLFPLPHPCSPSPLFDVIPTMEWSLRPVKSYLPIFGPIRALLSLVCGHPSILRVFTKSDTICFYTNTFNSFLLIHNGLFLHLLWIIHHCHQYCCILRVWEFQW